MNIALSHLRTLLPTFSSAESPSLSEEDEPISLSMLGCPIIDFIAVITRGSKAKFWLTPSNVEALVVVLCGWMQMTDEDVSVDHSLLKLF